MVVVEWPAEIGQAPRHAVIERGPHGFEGCQRWTEPAARLLQQGRDRIEVRTSAEPGQHDPRPRLQLQHGAGDDAKRALRPEEHLLQIIAGIVLDQLVQRRHHGAIGQHHLKAQHMVARHAIAHHPVAAGIGGEISADLARVARPEIEAEQQIMGPGRGLRSSQRDTGLNRHRRHDGIDLFDDIHPVERQRHSIRKGQRTAGKPGETALRYDGDAEAMADLRRGGDFRRGPRPHQCQWPHRAEPTPIPVIALRNLITEVHHVMQLRRQRRFEFILHRCRPARLPPLVPQLTRPAQHSKQHG